MRISGRIGWVVIAVAAMMMCRPIDSDAQREGEPAFRDVRAESVQLSNLDTEGVQATVRVAAIANVTATVESLVFDRPTINDLRINLPPVHGPMRLRQGEAVEGLPSLQAQLSFRELESLQPIRRIVEDERARFKATLRARLSLSLFQKLALMTTGAWVVTRVDQDVPVELMGGTFGRLAGLAVLTLAEPLWGSARIERGRIQAVDEAASAAVPKSMVAIETRYALTSRGGETAQVSHATSGFLVDDGTLLAPAEAIEPWLFDEAIAEAIENGDVSLQKASVDIIATPLAEGAGRLSLQGRQLRLGKTLNGSENALSTTTRRRFRLRFRAADSNAALLAVSGWKGSPLATADSGGSSEWQSATVVRLRRESNVVPELVRTAVRWDGSRYRIRDRVDAEAFGSPIWTEAGVVGLVQDEDSGASIKTVLRLLR